MMLGRSLRHRFFLFAAAAMLLLGAVISIAVEVVSAARLKESLGHDLSELAFHMVDKFDRGMWSRSSELAILTGLDEIRRPGDLGEARRILDTLQAAVPQFSWVGLLDPKGNVLAATGGVIEGLNIAHRPVYLEALDGPFIGEVHDAKLLASKLPNDTGEPMRFVDISLPITAPDGTLAAILATHLSWGWAREIEKSLIGDLQNRRDVELYIVSDTGEVLLSPKGAQQTFDKLDLQAVALARTNGRGWLVETWPDGGEYLTGYALEAGYKSYKGLGWTVLTRRPIAEAFQPIRELQATILIIGALFAVAFTVAWWFIAGAVSAPLNRLTADADRLARGEIDSLPLLDSGPEEVRRLSGALRNLVTALTSTEARARHMETLAHHDRLTGLPNRMALETVLNHLLPRARREGQAVACLCLDLDGFKPVNDTHGHAAGDEVLRQIAERLRGCLRGGDTVARLGGDEFMVVMAARADRWQDEAGACAARILAAVTQPIDLGTTSVDQATVRLGTSIGIAAWLPADGEDFTDVTKRADAALYEAKAKGKNRAEVAA